MDRYSGSLILVIFFYVTAIQTSEFITRDNKLMRFVGGQWLEFDLHKQNESSSSSNVNNKVHIKVFYETLCPGSIHFLTNQLRPTAEKLAPYLDIHLVPYGHAQTREVNGDYEFECQHGLQECFGNKMHACAVDVLKNNTQAALFNACLMEFSNYRKDPRFDYDIVVNWCNYKLKIHTEGLWACINGERSSILLKSYGEQTRAAGLRYIPYILIDESTQKQYEATRDLFSTVCRMLESPPHACTYRTR